MEPGGRRRGAHGWRGRRRAARRRSATSARARRRARRARSRSRRSCWTAEKPTHRDAEPAPSTAETDAMESAYFPWIGALHVLLDSLIDRAADAQTGQHSLVDHYCLRRGSRRPPERDRRARTAGDGGGARKRSAHGHPRRHDELLPVGAVRLGAGCLPGGAPGAGDDGHRGQADDGRAAGPTGRGPAARRRRQARTAHLDAAAEHAVETQVLRLSTCRTRRLARSSRAWRWIAKQACGRAHIQTPAIVSRQ